jgi:hypothetical protein
MPSEEVIGIDPKRRRFPTAASLPSGRCFGGLGSGKEKERKKER